MTPLNKSYNPHNTCLTAATVSHLKLYVLRLCYTQDGGYKKPQESWLLLQSL